MSVARRTTLLALIAAVVPVTLSAQPLGKIVVTPYVGIFAPNAELAKTKRSDGTASRASSIEQRNGLALGATGTYWFAQRAGIELGALYTWSAMRSTYARNEPGVSEIFSESQNAGVILSAAKLMVGLFPTSSEFQLRLGVGPAVIAHLGSGHDAGVEGKLTGRTNFGAAVSLCTKVPIANRTALRLRIEDYVYAARLGWKNGSNPGENYSFDRRFQHDFVLSTGLQIGLMR